MAVPFTLLMALQVVQTGITGVVRDDLSENPLGGVVLTLPDLGKQAVTDQQGRFHLADLHPGPHHLVVRGEGFEPRTLHALVPRGEQLELGIALRPAPIQLEGLTVTPRLAIRAAEAEGGRGRAVRSMTRAAVRNHPLLAEADVFGALAGGDVAIQPESPTGVHIRGGSAGQTRYELDGVPVLAPYHAAGLFSAWNPDALASIQWSPGPVGSMSSLSGAVSGLTKTPGTTVQGAAALSTTQARVFMNGPISAGGYGYLVSVRAGFPGGAIPTSEPSRLRGESGDFLATFGLPAAGGRLRVLGYQSDNELSAGAIAEPRAMQPGQRARNRFGWLSRSLGVAWGRSMGAWRLDVRSWDTSGEAEASLTTAALATSDLVTDRAERGVMATLVRTGSDRSSLIGLRTADSKATYQTRPSDVRWASSGELTSATLFLGHGRKFGARTHARVDLDMTTSAMGFQSSPTMTLDVALTKAVTLSAAVSRRHQLAQSLRNEESVMGNVFPPDLHVVAGMAGVPVARGEEGVLSVAYQPVPGISLGARGYLRSLESIVTIATVDGTPFSAAGFDVGSATIAGFSAEGSISGSRYGLVADYAWQRVRHHVRDRTFVPSYAPTHRAQVGLIVHTSATSSVRVGTVGAWGRRVTALDGVLEWEACNLADGCELAGAPSHVAALGRARPPFYFKVDLGARKHWHLGLRSRETILATYGTLTNVFDRANILNYEFDPLTGGRSPIDMLPATALVIGLEVVF